MNKKFAPKKIKKSLNSFLMELKNVCFVNPEIIKK